MAVRTLRDFGALRDDAEMLGVGAGNEPTVFWLTNWVGRVFATDLYLEPGVWREFANEGMLAEPGRYWPGRWNPRRLVVQHMDARDLHYEDDSFDAVFSSSSLEHFGTVEDVRYALTEVERVLKPGGIFSVSTEFRLEGDWPGLEGCVMFDGLDIAREIFQPFEWEPVDDLDLLVTPRTLATERLQEQVVADYQRLFDRCGELVPHELELAAPTLVIRLGEHVFTSVHLALRRSF